MTPDAPGGPRPLAFAATVAADSDDGAGVDGRPPVDTAAETLRRAPQEPRDTLRDDDGPAALAADADDAPGYHLGVELARGGMGRIVLAEDLRLGREVVIKQLLADNPIQRGRFEREVRITARLEHPGIVPVYHAGELANGEPFYAMRRIHGRTLDLVIDEAFTMAERLALVPRFLVAVEAIAYAHARRIIHRDLKPQNILVGEFGEIVVVDWGLAKHLDGDDDDLASGERAVDAGGEPGGEAMALTRAGSVLGTPAYMAPEQANSEPADVRSDVYALGAVLYHLLGGAPPHRGSSLALTLVDIIEGRIEPITRRAPDVPPDLAAIVGRAMARDPAARYPDAGALAVDLRTFLAGKLVAAHAYSLGELLRRWVRRRRAGVGASAVLVVGLAVIAGLAFRRVEAERDRARTQQAASEALVGFVLDDLRPRVEAINKLPILEGVSREVDRYYQAVAGVGAGPSTDSLIRWGNAALLLADVAFARGDLPSTDAHLARARARLEDAAGQRLFAERALRRLAIVHQRLGLLAAAHDQLDDAEREYERGLAIHRALVAPEPAALGETLIDLGRVLQVRGQFARALDLFREARALLRRFPDDPDAQRALVFALASLGTAATERGQLAEAEAAHGDRLALAEARVKADPAALERRFDLAGAHGAVATALTARGQAAAARVEQQRAVDLLEGLTAFDPDNAAWRYNLAIELGRLGTIDYDLERYPPARASFARSLAVLTELHQQSPDNVARRSALAAAHYKVGLGESAVDDLPAARAAFIRAADLIRGLAASQGAAQELTTFLDAQAQIALQQHAYADGVAAIDEAVAVVQRGYRANGDAVWLTSEATLLVTRADLAKAMGDPAQAVAALRGALDRYDAYAKVATLRAWQRAERAAVVADLAALERRGPPPRRR